MRLSVPKAFVVLRPGVEENADTARSILEFCQANLAPYKRVRRLEFAILPKTISGKIRRVELRNREAERRARGERGASEFWSDDTDAPVLAATQTGLRPAHDFSVRQLA